MIDDDYGDQPIRADRDVAEPGYVLCECCHGAGVGIVMKCYGGSPVEVDVYCEECDGEGQVDIEEPAAEAPSVRTRMRDWKQA